MEVTTKYGKDNESIVYNLIFEKDGYFYYSIIRADGFNVQERAKARANRYTQWANSAIGRSCQLQKEANEGKDFLALGEPIKTDHHSGKSHCALIERNWERMRKSSELRKKAERHEEKAEYWADRENDINISMPESLELYKFKLEEAEKHHADLKSGKIPRAHMGSLEHAKKEANKFKKLYELANQLWG
ncbi:DUF3560 domain-containing protein [Gilliamella sp. Pra-s65]|uniref:DUF3560 domain-containing protein n=1 Tax=unclassified Gilliamella TaxID=2685620 RepID=UPI0013667C7D|nr:DUF3560 domain-containing protein [Gilliamella sp. Pra-s65]MWP74002.1 DUF3560 domain-containing protein [Gilliamella sp. Pra-s52]